MLKKGRQGMLFCFILFLFSCSGQQSFDAATARNPFEYDYSTAEKVASFFRYDPTRWDVIVCGHRGGVYTGFPENCLASLDRLRRYLPIFFEVDPRMTRDGIPVLMHDDTLDRTTTGKGALANHSLYEIEKLSLVDGQGNITSFCVPTVEEAIRWSSNRIVLNFDRKDVPDGVLCSLVERLNAHNCIFTVHNVPRAQNILSLLPDAQFSAFMGKMEKFEAFRDAGLLPHVVIAYMESDRIFDAALADSIHAYGIRCMVSTAPYVGAGVRANEYYQKVLDSHPDIIETDYPLIFVNAPGVRSLQ